MKTAMITGVTGQDGAYLSKFLLDKGYTVIGLTRNRNSANWTGLTYLGINDKIIIDDCDLLDGAAIIRIVEKYKPNEIYNLAAQSSVGLSFEQPTSTILFNINSVLNLLEAIRLVDQSIHFYQASSSEMFGKVTSLPITLSSPMHPLSPYAISKATGYWSVINFREAFGLFACNGILFNHESPLRTKNFFVKKVIADSVKIKLGLQEKLRVGNIDVKRDFGYAEKYVEAMWLLLQQSTPTDVIICSGKSISLRDIISYIFSKLEIDMSCLVIDKSLFRPVEIEDTYGSNSKAKEVLGWSYEQNFNSVLDIMIDEELRVQTAK